MHSRFGFTGNPPFGDNGPVDPRIPAQVDAADPDSIDSRRFLAKARRLVGRLGQEIAEKLLVAYYVMRDDATPAKAKATLAGALAYFLLPLDAAADVLPGIGLTDDAVAIALALAAVATSIRHRHVEMARETMRGWGLPVRDGIGASAAPLAEGD